MEFLTMSAHPLNTEASTPANSGDAVEDFADFLDESGELDEEEEEQPEEGDLEAKAEGEEAQDESEEPDLPAIDPPVSWGTDAKELFAQLPADLQQQISDREAQREKFVQTKAQEASEAKRSAMVEAESALAERQRQYADEIEYFAGQLAPQRPNPALVASNPALFYQLQAEYEQALVQQQELQQRAMSAREEARQRDQFAAHERLQADVAVLAQQIPDWNDVEKRTALLTEVGKIGAELGYSSELMAEATAQDVLALKTAMDWKVKAAKYDALQKGKMDKVRAAKTLPKVVRPGVAPTRSEVTSARSQQSWQNVKQAKSKEAQASAFADYLETSGHL
jgi:hypothetical protein